MKNFLTLLFVFIIPNLAVAQSYPGTDPRVPQDPNNVSTLEGQIVKVGEKNEYLYSYPRINLSLNPFGWVYGLYSFSGSYAVHSHVVLRADVSYLKEVWGDSNGVGFAIGAPIYFRKVYSGFFLEPGIQFGFAGDTSIAGPQMLVGWHWMWDTGLNVALAVGMGRDWSSDDDYYDPGIFPAGYFRVGYAFN